MAPWFSKEKQIFKETSVSFPGIEAEITCPKSIKFNYLDYEGKKQELEATGFFATVTQHEIDYLNGKIFLDYVSKLKLNFLLEKLQKHLIFNPPHIHIKYYTH